MRRNYQKEESYSHGLLIERFIRLDKRFLPDKSSIISCDKDFFLLDPSLLDPDVFVTAYVSAILIADH